MIKLSIDTDLNMLQPEQNIILLELNLETFYRIFLIQALIKMIFTTRALYWMSTFCWLKI